LNVSDGVFGKGNLGYFALENSHTPEIRCAKVSNGKWGSCVRSFDAMLLLFEIVKQENSGG
jgi:hypothetical protein